VEAGAVAAHDRDLVGRPLSIASIENCLAYDDYKKWNKPMLHCQMRTPRHQKTVENSSTKNSLLFHLGSENKVQNGIAAERPAAREGCTKPVRKRSSVQTGLIVLNDL
jgi:hypothetical protein